MIDEKALSCIETIRFLQNYFLNNHGVFTDRELEDIETVIKKLKTQPCEDECVTKAEVIDTIHKTIYGFFDIADDDSEEPINDKDELLLTINKAISNAVKALPSVTPQRSKGKWIIKDKMWSVCSVCGCQTRMMKKYNVPNYCPACGADMRESEEKKDDE